MEKQFKVTLKFGKNAERYQVIQIVGPEVVVEIRGGRKVRVSDLLTEDQTKILGERAVLTTK